MYKIKTGTCVHLKIERQFELKHENKKCLIKKDISFEIGIGTKLKPLTLQSTKPSQSPLGKQSQKNVLNSSTVICSGIEVPMSLSLTLFFVFDLF